MSAGPTAGKQFIETADGKLSDQTLQERQLPYPARSFLYSALSLLALISGFVMSGTPVEWSPSWGAVFFLLMGLWACCSPFFWVYCAIFTGNPPSYWKIYWRVLLGCGLGGLVIGVQIYHTLFSAWPPLGVFEVFGLLILTTLVYTKFLPVLAQDDRFRVRHQVVWPVLLSIGFPLYIGVRYADLANHAFLVSLPILVVVTLAIASLRVPQGWLVLGGVFCFVGAILVSTFLPVLRIYMLSMMYSTIGAAYLASFEAWHLTSELARKDRELAPKEKLWRPSTQHVRWYYGVTIAITMSALATPALYIYSSFSPCVLLFIGFHSGLALGLWSLARTGDRLVDGNWGGYKIFMGSFVLVVLSCDVLFLSRWRPSPVPLPMNPLLFSFIAFLSAPPLFGLRQVIDDWRDNGVENLLSTTERSVSIVFYLSAIGVGLTILLYLSPVDSGPWKVRTTHACAMYLLYWIGAYMYLVRKWFSVKPVTP